VSKYLRKINLKDERFNLAHSFRSLRPWSLGPVAFGPMVKQNVMAEAHGGGKLLISEQPGNKKREEGVKVSIFPSKSCHQ
jgi:hypothetical protein